MALPSWMISTFYLTQAVQKKQILKELDSIKQINEALEQKKARVESETAEIVEKGEPDTGADYFTVPLKEGSKKIAYNDIRFIAVEDHYCKVVTAENGESREEWIRLTLKEALGKLPSSQFAQTHRSFIVNLQHVKKIKKEKQSYQLFLGDEENVIPASRHRAQTFLPKFSEFLA